MVEDAEMELVLAGIEQWRGLWWGIWAAGTEVGGRGGEIWGDKGANVAPFYRRRGRGIGEAVRRTGRGD